MQTWDDVSQGSEGANAAAKHRQSCHCALHPSSIHLCLLLLTPMMTKAHTRPGQASALFRRLPNEPWSGFGFGNYDMTWTESLTPTETPRPKSTTSHLTCYARLLLTLPVYLLYF